MKIQITSMRRLATGLALVVGLLVPNGFVYAHDPYDQWSEKRHQKEEKRDLEEHQRWEQYYYGNSRALREHQRDERDQLKHHQRHEKEEQNWSQRSERDRYYYRDPYDRRGDYYDNAFPRDRYYDNDRFNRYPRWSW
jgi:hypothetical protein